MIDIIVSRLRKRKVLNSFRFLLVGYGWSWWLCGCDSAVSCEADASACGRLFPSLFHPSPSGGCQFACNYFAQSERRHFRCDSPFSLSECLRWAPALKIIIWPDITSSWYGYLLLILYASLNPQLQVPVKSMNPYFYFLDFFLLSTC